MNFERVTNVPNTRIAFARSYGQLPDEYYGADMYYHSADSTTTTEQPKGLSTGAMIGIGVGVIALVGVVLFALR